MHGLDILDRIKLSNNKTLLLQKLLQVNSTLSHDNIPVISLEGIKNIKTQIQLKAYNARNVDNSIHQTQDSVMLVPLSHYIHSHSHTFLIACEGKKNNYNFK